MYDLKRSKKLLSEDRPIFEDLESSRPRPSTSKTVLEVKDVLEAATSASYINTLRRNAFFSAITLPTRVTENSQALIDHLLSNISTETVTPCILKCDLSDHYPIFALYSKSAPAKDRKPSILFFLFWYGIPEFYT